MSVILMPETAAIPTMNRTSAILMVSFAEGTITEVNAMLNNAMIDKLILMKLKIMAEDYIITRTGSFLPRCAFLQKQAYAKPRLLIINEWLATKPNANDLHAINDLTHCRRRKSSTIFCSLVRKD